MWVVDSSDDKIYAYNLGFISEVTALSSTQITLSLDAIAGVSIYRIYRSTEVDGVYTALNPVTGTSFTDSGLDASTKYYYQISACTLDSSILGSADSCSDRTLDLAQANATTMPSSDAEYSLVFNSSANQINLSWTTTGTNFVRISVSTATDSNFINIYSGTATSFVNTNLAAGTSYYYRLQLCADNSIGSCFGLDTVSSQQTYTTPDAYSFSNFTHYNSVKDLVSDSNTWTRGIWSDGTTMWVAEGFSAKVYAYNLATKAYDSGKDFNTLDDAGNDSPEGLWSDGTTMWIVDSSDNKILCL